MSRAGGDGGGRTREFAPRLRAIGKAIHGQDIASLCGELVRRIRYIHHKTTEGTYVLADSEGFVYVLRQQSCFTERMVKQLQRMVVGLYVASPTPERIASDLIQHFLDVGFIDIPRVHGNRG